MMEAKAEARARLAEACEQIETGLLDTISRMVEEGVVSDFKTGLTLAQALIDQALKEGRDG